MGSNQDVFYICVGPMTAAGFVATKKWSAQRAGFYRVRRDGVCRCEFVVGIEADFDFKVLYTKDLMDVFGTDIPDSSMKRFFENIDKGRWERPTYDVVDILPKGAVAAYADGTIYVSRAHVEQALDEERARWTLYLALLEENAHHVDHLLRETYCTIKQECSALAPDAPGDEGKAFVKRFLNAHRIADKKIFFATVTFQAGRGRSAAKRTLSIDTSKLSTEVRKAMHAYFDQNRGAERGRITLPNGRSIEVEFFKIEGQGAIHEAITKQAAKSAGVVYDDALDKGVVWPDVPCPSAKEVGTCYARFLDLELDRIKYPEAVVEWYYKDDITYESHYGENQYWHSMSSSNKLSNENVRDLILAQARTWYEQANAHRGISSRWYNVFSTTSWTNEGSFNDKGLFFVGKILHMVQDSYSHAHTIRDGDGRITSFQNYNLQDASAHARYDKGDAGQLSKIPGATDAIKASDAILRLYKDRKPFEDLETYLKENVYALDPASANAPSGALRPGTEKKN